MSLTINDTWHEGAANGKLVILLDIDDGTSNWYALSGAVNTSSDLYGQPIAVQKVSPVGTEYDPVTRELKRGELWADVDLAWIRPMLVNGLTGGLRPIGQRIDAYIGWHNCDQADFVLLFRGLIEDFHPTGDGTVKIKIGDVFGTLETTELTGTFINKHPLEVLYHATDTSCFTEAGLVAAQINTTSFDPTQYGSTISHFCTTGYSPGTHEKKIVKTKNVYKSDFRGGVTMEVKKTVTYEPKDHNEINALETVNDFCQLLYGMVRTDEDGKLEFLEFDSSASSVADLTVDDIMPGTFKQISTDGVVINEIMCSYGNNHKMRVKDTTSQSDYAQAGSSKRIFSRDISTNWIEQMGKTNTTSLNAADTTVSLTGPIHNFCGNRWPGYPAGSQPATAVASGDRPIYVRYTNVNVDEDGVSTDLRAEIAKYTTSAPTNGFYSKYGVQHVYDPSDGSRSEVYFNKFLYLTNGTRGTLGTTSIVNATPGIDLRATDVTMLVHCCQAIMDRCRYGMHVVELDVPLRLMDVQEGDLVTLTLSDDYFVGYGLSGLTTSTKWELVKKEVIAFEGKPRIAWRLAGATTGTASLTAPDILRGRILDDPKLAQLMASKEDRDAPFVVSGGTVTAGVGLAGTIAATVVSYSGGRAYIPAAISHTFLASRDCYVRLSLEDHSVAIHYVANSDPEPPLQHDEVKLAKVVTGAAAISTITSQIGRTRPLDGTRIIGETITHNEVGDGELGVIKQKVGEMRAVNINGDWSHWTKG